MVETFSFNEIIRVSATEIREDLLFKQPLRVAAIAA
jgi:hypothetical protein